MARCDPGPTLMAPAALPSRALIVHTETTLRSGPSILVAALPAPEAPSASREPCNAFPEGERLIDLLRAMPWATERVMSSGETLHAAGQRFDAVSLPLLGCFKVVSRTSYANGRIVSLHLRGDWIGLDAMISGWHAADVVAVGSARVLAIELKALRRACKCDADLFALVQDSMRRALTL
ncbi:hypothetical protein BH11PSE9_BH11PSE9_09750 [soil metagenome]